MRSQVKSLVETAVREKRRLKGSKVADGWWRRFMQRNSKLSLRRGDATANVRMDSYSRDC